MKYSPFRFLMVLLPALLLACGLSFDLGSDSPPTEAPILPAPPTAPPPAPTQVPTPMPEGWTLYQSASEGFEIAHPTSYSALDDEANLYGWPNGVLLLYNQGQSYDIVVQAWSSLGEMNKVLGADLSRATIFPADNKIFTVMDITQEAENASVIATFHLIE